MKQAADKYTIDAFEKPLRGRPRSPTAKSSAQRQREFRQRRKFNFLIPGTRNEK
jgi:hypothetical protein